MHDRGRDRGRCRCGRGLLSRSWPLARDVRRRRCYRGRVLNGSGSSLCGSDGGGGRLDASTADARPHGRWRRCREFVDIPSQRVPISRRVLAAELPSRPLWHDVKRTRARPASGEADRGSTHERAALQLAKRGVDGRGRQRRRVPRRKDKESHDVAREHAARGRRPRRQKRRGEVREAGDAHLEWVRGAPCVGAYRLCRRHGWSHMGGEIHVHG